MAARDLALLARWRDGGDGEAFRELTRLHGGMVFATCRRITGSVAEAEISTQECFEALAAAGGTPRESVGAWLHGMATHKALNRNRAERRRLERESRFAESRAESDAGVSAETGRIVNEALAELPETLSGPVVAHYFEKRSHGEIAESLGVSRQTVTYRIGKSLGLLERSLARRGVTLGAGVLIAALAAQAEDFPAGELPESLGARLDLIASSARRVPVAGSRVGARASRIWTHGAAWMGLAFLIGVVGWSYLGPGRGEVSKGVAETGANVEVEANLESVKGESESEVVVDEVKVATPLYAMVSGYVGDEAGYAVAGAVVTVAPLSAFYGAYCDVNSAETDALGRYAIADADMDGAAMVVVNAEGHRAGSQEVALIRGEAATEVDFILRRGGTLNGRVTLATGEAVEGARVIEAGYAEAHGAYGVGGFRNVVSTDADGRFSMGSVERGIAALRVVSADGREAFFERVEIGDAAVELSIREPAIVRGVVTGADGLPAANVAVQVRGEFTLPIPDQEGEARGVFAWRTALTDADGRYDTGAIAAGQNYLARVVTRDESRAMSGEVALGVIESGTLEKDFALKAGMTLRGTVRGATSGAALARTVVRWEKPGTGAGAGWKPAPQIGEAAWRAAEANGEYALEIFEAGVYRVWAEFEHGLPEYLRDAFCVEVKVSVGAELAQTGLQLPQTDLQLPDPVTFSVQAVDSAGAAVADAEVELWAQDSGEGPRRVTPEEPLRTDAEGRFSWGWFPPDVEAWFQVTKAGYVSAQSQRIVGAPGVAYESGPVVLYASGGVEGGVVDAAGNALADAVLVLRMTFEGIEIRNRGFSAEGLTIATRTDSRGGFAVAEGLPAGLAGRLTITAHPLGGVHHVGVVEGFAAVAGRVVNLGEVEGKSEG